MTVLIKHARPTNLGHQQVVLDGRAVEHETFACGHCGAVRVVPHRADPASVGGLCKQCMKLTCPACTAKGRCTPLERRLAERLSTERLLKQVG